MVGLVVAAGVAAAGSMASGAMGSAAAGKAAGQQADAERQAAELQHQQYEETRADLLPYNQAGQSVLPDLLAYQKKAQDALTSAAADVKAGIPGPFTEDWLRQQPGYQWNLSQGMKAMQSSAAARGLGVSGAALKGAQQWGTGLADSTYKTAWDTAQQRFTDLQQNFKNIYDQFGQGYDMTKGIATLGENAAAQTGDIGAKLATGAAGNLAGAGQAEAAGTTAGAQSLSGGLQALSNAPMNYLMYQKAFGGGSS